MLLTGLRSVVGFLACAAYSAGAWAAHGYAQFGDIKYPPGFSHFEWANPAAPKGGDIELVPPLRISSFDKYNPFTLKGTSAPGLSGLVFESLLTGTYDEPTTAYGLLAEDVEVAADRLSATHQSPRALPQRQTGHRSRREAQLRHPGQQAGASAIPRRARRREPRGRHRPAHDPLRFQDRQR
jgi:hypothetical protein